MNRTAVVAALASAAFLAGAPAAGADQNIVVGSWGGAWSFENQGTGTGGFVEGPASAPLGIGSYRLNTNQSLTVVGGVHRVFLPVHAGLNLSRVERLAYSVLRLKGTQAPVLELDLRGPDEEWVTTLVFEPPSAGLDTWERFNATALPYWRSVAPIAGAETEDVRTSLSVIQAANPWLHLGVQGISIRLGVPREVSYDERSTAFVDAVQVGTVDPRADRVWRTYDFEGTWDWQKPF